MSVNNQQAPDFDVFISYRHETGFYMAQIIYTRLIANGYTVFMDKTMNSGKFEEKIHSAIQNSRNFIVVLFPEDLPHCGNRDSWLNKEAGWAIECPNINIIPVMCDGFEWPNSANSLTDTMCQVMQNNGILVHKDYSLDADLDKLCDSFLKNVSPSKPRINTNDFFRYNLTQRDDLTVCGVDVAFHAGAQWLLPGEKNTLLRNSLKKNIPWRVLINTPEAAESIACNMRDENALYVSFDQARAQWKKLAAMYPDSLEVRECCIPLIHVHHNIRFADNTHKPYGEMHIRYYAYNNLQLDNAYEHEVSSFSKFYAIYAEEFEFLWSQSRRL